jgi:methenyltetrahydromethanopterin cyclohydrolase
MTQPRTLNERALQIADDMAHRADELCIAAHATTAGARILDCGIQVSGGLQAGLSMARACLAGLAEIHLALIESAISCPYVRVFSDQPVAACLAAQYAGWQIQVGKFFAMGSGPMRAIYGKEALFDDIPGREHSPVAVGILETRKLPDDSVVEFLCQRLQIPAAKLTLLAAPTSSLAGTVQIVARSLETALHKLHELHFDLARVVSGFGSAPLPPVAADNIQAIGRTNDAVLYGGRVTLWVRGIADEALTEIGPKVPSAGSPDFGCPFAVLFERYGRDFYKIDPMLFSPAEITFHNLDSGNTHRFGETNMEILHKSFFSP